MIIFYHVNTLKLRKYLKRMIKFNLLTYRIILLPKFSKYEAIETKDFILSYNNFKKSTKPIIKINKIFPKNLPNILNIKKDIDWEALLKCTAILQDKTIYQVNEEILKYFIINFNSELKIQNYLDTQLALYKGLIKHIKGKSILDVGSGNGIFPLLLKLTNPYLDITASDKWFITMKFIKRYAKKNKIFIKLKKLNILKPTLDKIYDTVIISNVLEHFKEKFNTTVINNCLKLAKCRVIIAVPFEKRKLSKGHLQNFNITKLINLAKKPSISYKIVPIDGWNPILVFNKK